MSLECPFLSAKDTARVYALRSRLWSRRGFGPPCCLLHLQIMYRVQECTLPFLLGGLQDQWTGGRHRLGTQRGVNTTRVNHSTAMQPRIQKATFWLNVEVQKGPKSPQGGLLVQVSWRYTKHGLN